MKLESVTAFVAPNGHMERTPFRALAWEISAALKISFSDALKVLEGAETVAEAAALLKEATNDV